MRDMRQGLALSLASVMAAGGMATPTWAQQGSARATALEEVIVTAERREASLQDTPISAVAFGEAQIDKLGIKDLADIQNTVPNLTLRQFPNSQASLRAYIRGVGNNDVQMSLDPGVAVYLDGIYIGRSVGLASEVASLERIEVLRGPQGSLYGRNTIGGAINLIPSRPTGELGLRQTLSVGNNEYWRSRTELNLPEAAGVSAKLSLLAGEKDGQVENKGSGPNFGDNENLGARIALNWSPTDNFSADYAFDYSDVDSGVLYYQTIATPNPGFASVPYASSRQNKATPSHPVDESKLDIKGHTLILTWEVGNAMTLKSLTGYRELEQDLYQDYGANAVTPRLFANDPFDNTHDQFSQELQMLGSLMNDGIEYVAGLYYFEEEGDEFTTDYISIPFPPTFALNEIELPTRFTKAKNEAQAAYGHLTWTPEWLDRRLHLTYGIRYSEDDREVRTERYAAGFRFLDARADDSWDNTSSDVTVSFDIAPDVNVYAKYVEGYKTGGFNGRGTTEIAVTTPVDEETLNSIEAGIKAQFFDNRVRFNAAVFDGDYEDIQLSFAVLGDPTNVVNYNAGKATIKGAEVDLSAVLAEGLVLSVNYGYLDTSVDEVINPDTGEDESKTNRYVVPGAPENTYNVDLDYTFPAFEFGMLALNVNYSSRDEFEFVSLPRTGYVVPDYEVWNARLTLSDICVGGPGRLAVSIWGKNLDDEEYLLDGIEAFPWSPLVAPFGEERTYGIDLTYEF